MKLKLGFIMFLVLSVLHNNWKNELVKRSGLPRLDEGDWPTAAELQANRKIMKSQYQTSFEMNLFVRTQDVWRKAIVGLFRKIKALYCEFPGHCHRRGHINLPIIRICCRISSHHSSHC